MENFSAPATVLFFNLTKGEGKVVLEDGRRFFFEKSALERDVVIVSKGNKVHVTVTTDASGRIKATTLTLDTNVKHVPAHRPTIANVVGPVSATVKWFDAKKGFGFVNVEGVSQDIFVHVTALNAAGIARLREKQPVTVSYGMVGDRFAVETISVDPIQMQMAA